MTQAPRSSQNQPQGSGPSLPAVISALIVLAVFAGLAIMLFGSAPQNTASVAATEEAVPTSATASEAATTPEAAAASSDAGSRNDKYAAQGMPPMTIDPAKTYTATITTPRGDIVITLRPDLAPKTVNSFVFLAREGFYDGTTWHRVLDGFVAQGGDPTGTGTGGPGYSVPGEFTDKVLFDKAGIVAMARAQDPDSAGSQFFITLGPTPNLNSQYTIFGEVTSGQNIVDGIPKRDPSVSPDAPPGEAIEKISISEE